MCFKKIGTMILAVSLLTLPLIATEYATTDSGIRVELFDDGTWALVEEVSEENSLETAEEPQYTESKWISSVKIDPLDDSRVASYILKADSGESSWGDPIYLVIRETDGYYEFYLNWDEYLGLDEILVTHRVGDFSAVAQEWSISTSSKASFYPWNGRPGVVELLTQLTTADQFIARCTPYGENPVTAIFDIRGLAQELKANGSKLP